MTMSFHCRHCVGGHRNNRPYAPAPQRAGTPLKSTDIELTSCYKVPQVSAMFDEATAASLVVDVCLKSSRPSSGNSECVSKARPAGRVHTSTRALRHCVHSICIMKLTYAKHPAPMISLLSRHLPHCSAPCHMPALTQQELLITSVPSSACSHSGVDQ